ncbi:hypothetical protein [Pararhodonellum marinum]|uniref:hypothetical protein n=1 Tax=Pararhodonellum marinum TaxID=2755358 RepID=UPI00188EA639|nr:hypothetical protein [Pararhodonellum marinum]
MHYPDLDEIFRKGSKEAETIEGKFADQAKDRVWDAIELPKCKSTVDWKFFSAMAAAVSFFLVSVFLFLKLETKEKELVAWQAKANLELSAMISQSDNQTTFGSESPKEKVHHEASSATKPFQRNEKLKTTHPKPKWEVVAVEEVEKPEVNAFSVPENLEVQAIPALEIPEFQSPDLITELVFSEAMQEEVTPSLKSKTERKIKFRIGNGSQANGHQNDLSLNIKL